MLALFAWPESAGASIVPEQPATTRSAYLKFATRSSDDRPCLGPRIVGLDPHFLAFDVVIDPMLLGPLGYLHLNVALKSLFSHGGGTAKRKRQETNGKKGANR
jgi:hypothetical protein